MKYTGESTIKTILDKKNGSEILEKHGVPCLSCPMAASEMGTLTIGNVAEIYKLDLEKIINDLNKGLPISEDISTKQQCREPK